MTTGRINQVTTFTGRVRPKRTQPLTTRSLLIATEITFEGTGVYFVITPGSSRFVRD